jgi:uncharacterized protein YndB with AHSA1/START domain
MASTTHTEPGSATGPEPAAPLPAVVHHLARAGSSISVSIDADRDTVFAHLSDPRTYPAWLTGAQAIREVDDDWPAVGTSFAHRVGIGPIQVHDRTTVVSVHPPDELELHAAIGPVGSARVRFRLTGSDPTEVVFEETPATGTLRLASLTVGRLLVRTSIWGRNRVSLERLKQLIEQPDEYPGDDVSG